MCMNVVAYQLTAVLIAQRIDRTCAGIRYVEDAPGYERVLITPQPDVRLDWLKGELNTRHGKIVSHWMKEDTFWRYEIETPVDAEIHIGDEVHLVSPGSYCFYSPQ